MGPLVGKAKSNLMELAAEWNQTKIKFCSWEEKKLLSFGLGCFQNLHNLYYLNVTSGIIYTIGIIYTSGIKVTNYTISAHFWHNLY